MDKLFEYVCKFDFPTILGMFAITWYFTRELKSEVRAETQALRDAAAQQTKRTDQLYQNFIDLLKEKK